MSRSGALLSLIAVACVFAWAIYQRKGVEEKYGVLVFSGGKGGRIAADDPMLEELERLSSPSGISSRDPGVDSFSLGLREGRRKSAREKALYGTIAAVSGLVAVVCGWFLIEGAGRRLRP